MPLSAFFRVSLLFSTFFKKNSASVGVFTPFVSIEESETKMNSKTTKVMNSKLFTLLFVLALTAGTTVAQENAPEEIISEQALQLSFIPVLGTNFAPSGSTINNISLNVLAGYNYGVNGVELGGFVNVDRSDVRYLQLAGFVNLVGGNMTGLQGASFVNGVRREVTGAQLSGFVNLSQGVTGAQGSGFVNYAHGKVDGVQGTGFVNFAYGDVTGAQGSGFVNYAHGHVTGAQGTGFVNYAKSATGLQWSGFVNYSNDSIKGAQLSGFYNHSKVVTGVQASGFANFAKTLRGFQVGIVNIADTVEKGATIGLLNIVRTGKHEFAITTNDVTDINAAFRSGTNKFYSVLEAGIQTGDDPLWAFGVGFGTQFKPIKDKIIPSIELGTYSVNRVDDWQDDVNQLTKLSVNVGYNFFKSLSVNAGPVLNIYATRTFNSDTGRYGLGLGENGFYDQTFSGTNVKAWVGYQIGVRF